MYKIEKYQPMVALSIFKQILLKIERVTILPSINTEASNFQWSNLMIVKYPTVLSKQ